jgi:hypothetical protein
MVAISISDAFSLLLVPFCAGGIALCMWITSHDSHKNSNDATKVDDDTPGLEHKARFAALEVKVQQPHGVDRNLDDRTVGSDAD